MSSDSDDDYDPFEVVAEDKQSVTNISAPNVLVSSQPKGTHIEGLAPAMTAAALSQHLPTTSAPLIVSSSLPTIQVGGIRLSAAPATMAQPGSSDVERWPFVPVEVYRHRDGRGVNSVSINPYDGKSFLSAGRDGNIAWFGLNHVQNELKAYEARIGGSATAGGKGGGSLGAFFKNGLPPTRVVSPFINRVNGTKQSVACVSWAVDGSFFVACEDGDCPVTVSAGGKVSDPLPRGQRNMMDVTKAVGHKAPVVACATSKTMGEAGIFATGSRDSSVRLWDVKTACRGSCYVYRHGSGKLTEQVQVNALEFWREASAKEILSGGSDGKLQLWDTAIPNNRNKPQIEVDVGAPVTGCTTVAGRGGNEGQLVAVRSMNEDLKIFDLRMQQKATTSTASSSMVKTSTIGSTQAVSTINNLPLFGDTSGVASTMFADGSMRIFAVTSNQHQVPLADGVIKKAPCVISIDTASSAANFPVVQTISLDGVTSKHLTSVACSSSSNQLVAGTSDGSVVVLYRPTTHRTLAGQSNGNMVDLLSCWRGVANKRERDRDDDDDDV